MSLIEIEMTFQKSTPGTHVYANADSAIPSLYIKKNAFTGKPPSTITVQISVKGLT